MTPLLLILMLDPSLQTLSADAPVLTEMPLPTLGLVLLAGVAGSIRRAYLDDCIKTPLDWMMAVVSGVGALFTAALIMVAVEHYLKFKLPPTALGGVAFYAGMVGIDRIANALPELVQGGVPAFVKALSKKGTPRKEKPDDPET